MLPKLKSWLTLNQPNTKSLHKKKKPIRQGWLAKVIMSGDRLAFMAS